MGDYRDSSPQYWPESPSQRMADIAAVDDSSSSQYWPESASTNPTRGLHSNSDLTINTPPSSTPVTTGYRLVSPSLSSAEVAVAARGATRDTIDNVNVFAFESVDRRFAALFGGIHHSPASNNPTGTTNTATSAANNTAADTGTHSSPSSDNGENIDPVAAATAGASINEAQPIWHVATTHFRDIPVSAHRNTLPPIGNGQRWLNRTLPVGGVQALREADARNVVRAQQPAPRPMLPEPALWTPPLGAPRARDAQDALPHRARSSAPASELDRQRAVREYELVVERYFNPPADHDAESPDGQDAAEGDV